MLVNDHTARHTRIASGQGSSDRYFAFHLIVLTGKKLRNTQCAGHIRSIGIGQEGEQNDGAMIEGELQKRMALLSHEPPPFPLSHSNLLGKFLYPVRLRCQLILNPIELRTSFFMLHKKRVQFILKGSF